MSGGSSSTPSLDASQETSASLITTGTASTAVAGVAAIDNVTSSVFDNAHAADKVSTDGRSPPHVSTPISLSDSTANMLLTSDGLQRTVALGAPQSLSTDGYEHVSGNLTDEIHALADLTVDSVRDILRRECRDHSLQIARLGPLEDLSGTNDAFNSTLVRMCVDVERGQKQPHPAESDATVITDPAVEKTYHFVIKSPPRMTFIQMVHKLTRPFFREVAFYTELMPQWEAVVASLNDKSEATESGDISLHEMIPHCYYAYSKQLHAKKMKWDSQRAARCQARQFRLLDIWLLVAIRRIPDRDTAYFISRQMGDDDDNIVSRQLCLCSSACASLRRRVTSNKSDGRNANKTDESDGTMRWLCQLLFRSVEVGILVLEHVGMSARPQDAGLGPMRYAMTDKRQPMDLAHVCLAMRHIAHFHGQWLLWIHMVKERDARRNSLNSEAAEIANADRTMDFAHFKFIFNWTRRLPLLLMGRLQAVALSAMVKALRKRNGPNDAAHESKIRSYYKRKAMAIIVHYAAQELKAYFRRPPEAEPVYTLTHGDFWSNNILFGYKVSDASGTAVADDDSDNKPVAASPSKAVLIDFQLANYGHPAYDLVYFMYLNTDLEFRDAHLDEALRTYYDVFAAYLARLYPSMARGRNEKTSGESDGFVYTWNDFLADYRYHRPLGVTAACSVMPNIMSATQINLEQTGLAGLREMERKQQRELDDDVAPTSIEIRRRLAQIVDESIRDGIFE